MKKKRKSKKEEVKKQGEKRKTGKQPHPAWARAKPEQQPLPQTSDLMENLL